MQVRKTSYNMTTISRKKMVSKLADKWKGTVLLLSFLNIIEIKRKKRSKKRELE